MKMAKQSNQQTPTIEDDDVKVVSKVRPREKVKTQPAKS